MSAPGQVATKASGLRERHAQTAEVEDGSSTSSGQSTPEVEEDELEKDKKTFGRTPDGTIFTVPQTHDMVSQLLDPRQPKNLSDITVLAVLALHMLALYLLPFPLKRPVFAVIFLFWRGCYNVGIGWLLHIQSNHKRLISWAKKWNLFENPSSKKNPRPWLYKLIKTELETKIPEDYKFEEAPLEYNTWLVFRRVVDLILMCDFTSYCLFAIACGGRPVGESFGMTFARWAIGIILVGFNLWVKLDAHRVVKDYAWYWGDFFYLIDQELTFDGVFEMAPHPMYSVGYAGYYGISMMAASYNVLFISIIAHAAQFVFLVYVENPHIEKTYNPPPPRKREDNPTPRDIEHANASAARKEGIDFPEFSEMAAQSIAAPKHPLSTHNMMGNIDLFRITDLSILLLQGYVLLLTLWTPSTPFFQALFIINAIGWRLWYTVGLGFLLHFQSNKKMWTRHFVKFGESTDEAWRQWKGMYHLSMTMCYASFIAAAWKMYSLPPDWGYGLVLLKHVIGTGLVALQVWTAVSIYESLGEFGWFFGDFFFDHAPKLTYSGIYRYLNNPERIIGLAGIWGAAFITRSRAIFLVALVSHVLTLGFIQFVEKPHMQRLYGRALRSEAGLTKSIRRSLPPPVKKWQGSIDKVLGDTSHFVEDFLDMARPKLAAGVSTIVRDTTALFSQYPARITLTRLAPDLAGFDPRDYSIKIEGTPLSALSISEIYDGKEGQTARFPRERTDHFQPLIFEYGAPIKVTWTGPVNHSAKDWIGLYMVADNQSRDVTRVSSAGRWIATVPNKYESTPADKGILVYDQKISGANRKDGSTQDYVQGEMVFEGDKLWWTHGVFELRYHHDGKHNVMAISLPFEVRIGKFDEEDVDSDSNGLIRAAVEEALLPMVRNCFDRDPEIAPNTVDESFGSLVERDGKYAKRVVFAVHQMFGIEFAPGVVLADGNVKKLAWRICNAKQVLAPYSMSHSKGTTTPTGERAEKV
ncbi:phospholipid methyltransferase-domain-containing protein [Tricladium varicosporioides]|nr:phospholipid methyltransferase-domain-containing protein [Hymenoscyphus varicosporioides]